MIKATMTDENGRTVLMVGLSFGNLAKFKAMPMDTFIKIDGKAMGLPIDVLLFSGETEGEMGRFFAGRIGPETRVHIDPKLAT
jgi:hypothetical protein